MALVCVLFLLHVRSALVAIITLPLGVLIAYICMHALGLSSNIMSLGGIAIAIGAMVDAAIVMIENAHKHLERAPAAMSRIEVLIEAASEVGPALFFSLLVITVSFLPIFTLEAQEGRLFKPLAFTKTFAMAAAALLSVTLVPALMVLFVRGRILPERRNPVNLFLIWIYRPMIKASQPPACAVSPSAIRSGFARAASVVGYGRAGKRCSRMSTSYCARQCPLRRSRMIIRSNPRASSRSMERRSLTTTRVYGPASQS